MLGVAPGLVPQAIRDHGHPAALLVNQLHAISNSVHYLDESLPHLGMLELG